MSNTRIYIYNLYNCLQLGWDGGKKKFLVQSEGWTFSSVVESSQLMTINLLLIIRCVLDWKEHSFNLMRLNHLNGSVGKTLYSRFSWDNAQLSYCCSSCLLWIHAHYQLSTSGWLLNIITLNLVELSRIESWSIYWFSINLQLMFNFITIFLM